MDPEWLIGFGLRILGVPEAAEWVRNDWIDKRRPPLREHLPYFIFMLTIDIFFCLILPTQLLRDVKPSHRIDLAYLYYLPFCTVFTSKDRFHSEIVPLFLSPFQSFVNGVELKEEMKKLDEHYSRLPECFEARTVDICKRSSRRHFVSDDETVGQISSRLEEGGRSRATQ